MNRRRISKSFPHTVALKICVYHVYPFRRDCLLSVVWLHSAHLQGHRSRAPTYQHFRCVVQHFHEDDIICHCSHSNWYEGVSSYKGCWVFCLPTPRTHLKLDVSGRRKGWPSLGKALAGWPKTFVSHKTDALVGISQIKSSPSHTRPTSAKCWRSKLGEAKPR